MVSHKQAPRNNFIPISFVQVFEDFDVISNDVNDKDDDRVCTQFESLKKRFEEDYYSSDQLDWAVENGNSQLLVQYLHETIVEKTVQSTTSLTQDSSQILQNIGQNQFGRPLDSNKIPIKNAALLCILLNGLLNCSKTTLEIVIDDVEWELTESIVHLLKVLPMSNDIEDNLKSITIDTALQIVQKCTKIFGHTHLVLIIDEMIHLINNCSYFLPTNVMISMAFTVSYVVRNRYMNFKHSFHVKVEDSVIRLLDTLSTISAVSMSKDITKQGLQGISNLAETPPLGNFVLQNECAVLTVVTYIRSDDSELQLAALDICQYLLLIYQPIAFWDCNNWSIVNDNVSLLQKVLVDSLLKTHEISIQNMIMYTLADLQTKPCRKYKEKVEIVDALYHVADNTYDVHFSDEASMSFLSCAGKIQINDELLTKIATFLSMDDKYTYTSRPYALWLIQDICTINDNAAYCVSNHSLTLSKLATIIGNKDSEQDSLDAIKICRQLVLNEINQYGICKEVSLLQSFVQLAITQPIKNRKAHAISVEILITLLSKKVHVNCFVPLANVLPWLVMLANRTCDDVLKASLIFAIRNLTTAVIHKAHEV